VATVAHDIADPALADSGRQRIDWAHREMPVVSALSDEFAAGKPLEGLQIGGCLHITTETANLARVLVAGGARVALCASNPLSTQDDVAAALVEEGVAVFAVRGEDQACYYGHIEAVLDHKPQLTMDDGADLISTLHRHRREQLPELIGGCEETTTGVLRLRAMAAEGALKYPVVAVNDALTKHLFDNRYGTGQSTLDGVIRATNILLAGRTFVVAGYGWCGRGIAMRARGHGAHVTVTEVDPTRALEAVMDGFSVMPLAEAAPSADFIVTATGDKHVVDREHLQRLKDGCVLANSGHFDVEINLPALREMAVGVERPRPSVDEYRLADGRVVRVLAEGRLVNLAAAEGHPSAVMDMSFANQALSLAWLASQGRGLAPGVHPVPRAIDAEVAERKLDAMDVGIDTLTEAQRHYLASWQEGT